MFFFILFWLWSLAAVLAQVKIYPESKATVAVNTMLTFRCVYTGDKDLLICSFWRNGTQITVMLFPDCAYTPSLLYNYSCPGRKECSASILSTSIEENGVKWKCEVRATGDSNYIQSPETEVAITVPIDSISLIVPETSTVTVSENTEVEIICRTSGGLPAANITWYKNSGTVGDSSYDSEITSNIESTISTKTNLIEVTSTLRYSPSRNENGWRIYCKASNVIGQTVLSTQKKLFLNVTYPPYVEPFNVDPVEEGSELSVECKTRPGNPANATFTWKRKFNSASDNTWQDIPDSLIDGGKLLKTNINRSDAGTYNCTAFNLMKPTAEQKQIGSNSQIFLLRVLYEASITSFFIDGHRGQTRVTVDENDGGIQFTCEVDSNPSSTVKIMFNGEVIKERSNTKQISMILSNAACLDSGEYTCKGDNQYGQVSMKSIKLFVNCSPRPLHQMRKDITSALHVPVTLSFTALAYPHPDTKGFAWFKENGVNWYPVLSNADLHTSASASQSNLTISNVSIADFGRYRLTVTNEIGSFVQYLILEEDLAENEALSENCQRCKEKTENTALITGISLGVVVAILAVYATSITILYKRNIGSKDKQVVVKESTQKTYVNIAYKPNVQGNETNDGTPEAEGDEARQYTDLVGYSRDDRTTYEVLQGL